MAVPREIAVHSVTVRATLMGLAVLLIVNAWATYAGYGEGAPHGRGPAQGRLQSEGNAYLRKEFPNLDYIKKATIEK